MSNLTGASVLLFEKDNLLLFREINASCSVCKKFCCYTEPGGKYEKKHDTIEDTAKDELYEETCCIFECNNINTRKNKNVFDLAYNKHKTCRVFILDIPYMKRLVKDYKSNLSILKSTGADKHFLETDRVIRVPISNLQREILTTDDMKNVYVKSTSGKIIKLRKRTATILHAFFISKVCKAKKITKVSFEKDEDGLIHYVI